MASKKLKINSSAPKVHNSSAPKMRKKKSFTLGTPKSTPPSPSPSKFIQPKSAPISNNNNDYHEMYKQTTSSTKKSYNNNKRKSASTYNKCAVLRDDGSDSSIGSYSGNTPRIKITTPTGAINTKTNNHDYKIGEYIRLNDDKQGYIRYVGQTAFSKHILYGIELDDKYDGKHSGIYKGVKYFDAKYK